MSDTEEKMSPLFLGLLIIAMIFWAGAWSSGKLISNQAAPEIIVLYRFLLSFLSMLPLIFFLGVPLKIDFKSFLFLVISAFLFVLYSQMFFKGLRVGLAGAGGVLVTTTNPVLTYLLVVIFLKVRLSRRTLLGLIAGLIGGAVLLRVWQLNLTTLFQTGNLYFILAAFFWSIVTIVSQYAQRKIHFFVYSCYLYGLSALIEIPFALPYDITSVFKQSPFFWANIVYLSLFSMAFSSTIYMFATKKIGSHRASSFVFILPVSTPLISYFVLGEIPTWSTVLGGIISLGAVYLINSGKERGGRKIVPQTKSADTSN